MRNKLKLILLPCLLFVVALLATSCSDSSPFEDYDKAGYTVSVKYDANGGVFTTNTTTIIDTYNLGSYTANSEGMKELTLFAPDAAERGNQAYTATKKDHYLVGWYAKRTETTDAEGKPAYTYSDPWDFHTDKLFLDANKTYSSKDVVKTLYAAWIPTFTYDYEFYVFDDAGVPQHVGTTGINPLANTTITLPCDNEETGRVMSPNSFPVIEGKTYDKIYLDADKTTELTAATLTHPGKLNKETVTVENRVMKIYCTVTDGVYYNITRPEQLTKNPNLNAVYTLENDLDFTGKYWPALFTSNTFHGKVIGNGHTIRNITITQNNNANMTFGLFGKLSESAEIRDVTFDNITVNIKQYPKTQGATFGILAGEVSGATLSHVVLQNSKMDILTGLSLQVSIKNNIAPTFGLVCAAGVTEGVTFSLDNITVTLSGNDTAKYTCTPDAHGQFTIVPTPA